MVRDVNVKFYFDGEVGVIGKLKENITWCRTESKSRVR